MVYQPAETRFRKGDKFHCFNGGFKRDKKGWEIPLSNFTRKVTAGKHDKPRSEEFIYKVLILGEGGVGKTQFVRQAFLGQFDSKHQETIGVDFKFAEFVHESTQKPVTLSVWNTSGN